MKNLQTIKSKYSRTAGTLFFWGTAGIFAYLAFNWARNITRQQALNLRQYKEDQKKLREAKEARQKEVDISDMYVPPEQLLLKKESSGLSTSASNS